MQQVTQIHRKPLLFHVKYCITTLYGKYIDCKTNCDDCVTGKNFPLILNTTWFRLSLVKEIMNMKKLNVTLAILVAAVMAGNAQTVTSDVVGYQKITLPIGGKNLAPTFVKSDVYRGSATISGNTVTTSTGALSSLTLGPTTFSAPVRNYPRYYAEVTSSTSPFYGYNFDITAANTGSSFTSANVPPALSGETVNLAIRAHLTIGDLDVPNIIDGDVVLIYDSNGGSDTYYKFETGWVDGNGTPGFSHVPIYPGTGVVFTSQSQENTITLVGTVKSTPTVVPLYLNAYANLVGPINPSTSINYVGQNWATSVGDGAAFTVFTTDGSYIENSTYYSFEGQIYDANGSLTTSANVPGGEAVIVGALSGDGIWTIPATVTQ